MADNQRYSKFVISSELDPASKGYSESTYNRDMKAIVREVIKSLPKGTFVSVGDKQITNSGKMSFDIYTHTENADAVRTAIEGKLSTLHYKGSDYEKYSYYSPNAINIPSSIIKAESERATSEDRKERAQSTKHTLGAIAKITGILTVLTDITRRILSSVLSSATESVRTATMAHNMGVSYAQAREFEHVETRAGLAKGTISGAIGDLQSKLVNELALDNSALDYLGVIMSSELSDLLMSELKAGKGSDALALILDRANEIVSRGESPTGEYLGVDRARIKMYEYLNKMFPQLADIFAKMQEQSNNVNSIYYGTFDPNNFSSWLASLLAGNIKYNTVDTGLVQSLGELTLAIKDLYERIKESITISLAPTLYSLLSRIANLRIGLSASENRQLNLKNFEANQSYISDLKGRLSRLPKSTEGLSLEEQKQLQATKAIYEDEIKEAEKENANLKEGKNVASMRKTENFLESLVGDYRLNMEAEGVLFGSGSSFREQAVMGVFSEEEIQQRIDTQKLNYDYVQELNRLKKEEKKKIDNKIAEFISKFPKQSGESTNDYNKRIMKIKENAGFGRIVYSGNMNFPAFEVDYSSIDYNAIMEQARTTVEANARAKIIEDLSKDRRVDEAEAIALEEAEANARANRFLTGGYADLSKINQVSRDLLSKGYTGMLYGVNDDSSGERRGEVVLVFKDDRGKELGRQLLYSGLGQTVYSGFIGTVTSTADGINYTNANSVSASNGL